MAGKKKAVGEIESKQRTHPYSGAPGKSPEEHGLDGFVSRASSMGSRNGGGTSEALTSLAR